MIFLPNAEGEMERVSREYCAALCKSRRHSKLIITAAVLQGWSDDEISYLSRGH